MANGEPWTLTPTQYQAWRNQPPPETTAWIVWEHDNKNNLIGVAGLYTNETAARNCQKNGPRRETEHFAIQAEYLGETRTC